MDTDNIFAILRYAGAPAVDPKGSFKPRGNLLSENDLHPTINPGAPGGSGSADVVIDLDFSKGVDAEKRVAVRLFCFSLPPSSIADISYLYSGSSMASSTSLLSSRPSLISLPLALLPQQTFQPLSIHLLLHVTKSSKCISKVL